MTYQKTKSNLSAQLPDQSIIMSNFDAATKLLNRFDFSKMSYKKKIEMFFVDYDLVPLLVQENYLTSMKKNDVK